MASQLSEVLSTDKGHQIITRQLGLACIWYPHWEWPSGFIKQDRQIRSHSTRSLYFPHLSCHPFQILLLPLFLSPSLSNFHSTVKCMTDRRHSPEPLDTKINSSLLLSLSSRGKICRNCPVPRATQLDECVVRMNECVACEFTKQISMASGTAV